LIGLTRCYHLGLLFLDICYLGSQRPAVALCQLHFLSKSFAVISLGLFLFSTLKCLSLFNYYLSSPIICYSYLFIKYFILLLTILVDISFKWWLLLNWELSTLLAFFKLFSLAVTLPSQMCVWQDVKLSIEYPSCQDEPYVLERKYYNFAVVHCCLGLRASIVPQFQKKCTYFVNFRATIPDVPQRFFCCWLWTYYNTNSR